MKIACLRVVAVLILQIPWSGASYCADPGSPQFTEEISKQEQIYRSKGELVPEGYVVDRSLLSYTHTLSPAFDGSLADLGPKDRWLDIGAGRGQAILDYYGERYDSMHPQGRERRGKKARAVAISIEDRRTPAWEQTAKKLGDNQIQYLSGRRLREYARDELGKFQVITDVIGGFSYTANFSLFVEQVLALLELNGSFYTVLQDVETQDGRNRPYYAGSPYRTEIAAADAADVKVCTWLKSIACVEVACEAKVDWKPPIETYRLRKVCNEVAVPALEAVRFEAGTPPERRFRLKN